jgi:uncharacterized phage-like protein YoqJ
MIFAATGHRPNKLGGYSGSAFTDLKDFAVRYLAENCPTRVISGMAQGWDQAWAVAAVALGIPFIAAVPFVGQESRWPDLARRRYRELLKRAYQIHYPDPGGSYAPWKMQARNMWMVDNCDRVIALWNGTEGGTANCVRYAERAGKPVENLWVQWAKHGG